MLQELVVRAEPVLDSTADLVETAGFWKALVLIILVLGFYLLNKFGSELLRLLTSKQDESVELSRTAVAQNESLAASLKTNHGSKRPGEAIDRLTELMWHTQGSIAKHQEDISDLRVRQAETLQRILSTQTLVEDLHNKFASKEDE